MNLESIYLWIIIIGGVLGIIITFIKLYSISQKYFTPKFKCHVTVFNSKNPQTMRIENNDNRDLHIMGIRPQLSQGKYGKPIKLKLIIESGKSETVDLGTEISFRNCKVLVKRIIIISIKKDIKVFESFTI